jgi:hypothetical protein
MYSWQHCSLQTTKMLKLQLIGIKPKSREENAINQQLIHTTRSIHTAKPIPVVTMLMIIH